MTDNDKRIEAQSMTAVPPSSKMERGETRQYPSHGLPPGYNEDKIMLMTRDPYWVHAYWEITENRKKNLMKEYSNDLFEKGRMVLRVYDVTGVDFNGSNARSYYDIDINESARNWYINVSQPNRDYIVEIGVIDKNGNYIMIVRSNKVKVPRDSVSDVIDERWMMVDEMYEKLFRLSGGHLIGLGSEEIMKMISQRISGELSSGGVSSFSGSGALPIKAEKPRKFWLVADTELIVYGATEPDAKLSVQGKTIPLDKDGTFSLRFALPDGDHFIPIKASSFDGLEEREIKITVKRKKD